MSSLVSIIVPAYRADKYLHRCIDSILSQTYSPIEIICIDDGSDDNTSNVLMGIAQKDSRVITVRNDKNEGAAYSRNKGLELANGEYVLFVDADDTLEKDAIEICMHYIKQDDLDVLLFDYSVCDDTGESIEKYTFSFPDGVVSGIEMFNSIYNGSDIRCSAAFSVYRKLFLLENKIKFVNGVIIEDVIFIVDCLLQAEKTRGINYQFYNYIKHAGSVVTSFNSKRGKSYFAVLLHLYEWWEEKKEYSKYNETFKNLFVEMYKCYRYSILNGEKDNYYIINNHPLDVFFECQLRGVGYWKLSDTFIDKIDEIKEVYVFGAGKAAKETVLLLIERNVSIRAVIVTDKAQNPDYFCSIKVKGIYDNDIVKSIPVVVGVGDKYSESVTDNLKKEGFKEIYPIDNNDYL